MKNLQKHMLQIAKKSKSTRKSLQMINYDSDTNTINVTDSFRVISVKSDVDIKNSFNINPKTMMIEDCFYPNINRILPNNDYDCYDFTLSTFRDDIEHFLKKDKKGMSLLYVENQKLFIEFKNDEDTIKFDFGEIKTKDKTIGHFNNKYLYDLLNFITDKLNTPTNIKIKHKSQVRPISFIFDDKYTYMLTPIIRF